MKHVKERVNDLLSRMTVEEKIGQMNQLWGIDLGRPREKPDDLIRQGKVGSILYAMGVERKNELQRIAVEESPNGIPLIFGSDVGHGYRTGFPIQLGMAASFNPELVEEVTTVIAKEARADGLHWTFYPMLDVCRDIRWGRIIEGAGEDPYLGSKMAAAQVKGFQGDTIGAPDHLLACAKHFVGYGAADGGRDYDPVNISEADLRNVYLPPFKAAVDAGVGTIMSAYMDLNNVPAGANPYTLRTILRSEWGFDGYVVSDASVVRSLITQGLAKDEKDAAYRSFKAGLNMDMGSSVYVNNLGPLIDEGKITEQELDAMVYPILKRKIEMGLFEHPYAEEGKCDKVSADPYHRELARKAAQQSMVLLKNDSQVLPLSQEIKRIAVIGPLADSCADTEGMIGLFVKPQAITVLGGIKNKLPEAEVVYAPGPWIKRDVPSVVTEIMPDFSAGREKVNQTAEEAEQSLRTAVEFAKTSDVVVMVIGETNDMSGESSCRSKPNLPGRQLELLSAIADLGKQVITVLITGRPLAIPEAVEASTALLVAWHPGWEGGNAVADILFGDANPGGKMPVSVPYNGGTLPLYYSKNNTHRPENNQYKATASRYWDAPSEALFPFGYGLSYTSFSFSDLKIEKEIMKLGEAQHIRFKVTNTGNIKGDEVAQMYIHQRYGSDSRPRKLLKGFQRVSLNPGESTEIEFLLGPEELSYWSSFHQDYVQDETEVDVWIGNSQVGELHTVVSVRLGATE